MGRPAWLVSFLPRRAKRAFAAAVASGGLAGLGGCISIDLMGGGAESELVETIVRGAGAKKILLLDIDGVIGGADLTGSLLGGPTLGTAARVAEVLDHARRDDAIAAILIRIDSPGGTATDSELVYEELRRFKAQRGVPVVAQLMGTATSGAYYVAMAADTIQAHPTTVTGSIGVVFTSLSFAGLMEKLGVEDQTLTAGEFKDAGSPLRRLSPTERAQLQTIVDDLHDRFREIVARGRPALSADQVAALANGQVFSARTALERGLVDRVGTLEESVDELERRLGVADARVVSFHRPREIRRNLYTRANGLPRIEPGFHFVWWPAVAGIDPNAGGVAEALLRQTGIAP